MVAGTVCLLVPRHCDTSCGVPAPCLPCNQHRVTAVSTRQASSSQALHPTPQRPSSTGGGAAMLLGGKEVGGRRLTAWHTECHGLSDSAVAPLPSRSRVLGPCPSDRAFPAQSPQHPQLTLHSSGDPGTVVDRSCPGQRLLAALQEYPVPPPANFLPPRCTRTLLLTNTLVGLPEDTQRGDILQRAEWCEPVPQWTDREREGTSSLQGVAAGGRR